MGRVTEYNAIMSEWTISMENPGRHGLASIRGRIYNDKNKRFENGEIVITSPLEYVDFNTMIARTKNTTYKLDTFD